MTPFDRFIMVDWSASGTPSPKQPSANAIWIADGAAVSYHRTREVALDSLLSLAHDAADKGQRLLIGVDFALGYPTGFAQVVTGVASTRALWRWIAERLRDGPDNANSRFELANAINASLPGIGPFWGRVKTRTDLSHLPWGTSDWGGHGFAQRRAVEALVPQVSSVWQLLGNGAVGGQSLTGIRAMDHLCQALGNVAVWPFEDASDAPVVLAEIYPTLIDPVVRQAEGIRDAAQVRLMAVTLAEMQARGTLDAAFATQGPDASEEGWILGACAQDLLLAAAQAAATPNLQPPRLKNDCFALPPGVDWEPVDSALARLNAALHPIVGTQTLPLVQAEGRVLAQDIHALRANPAAANTAVDGYGFAHASAAGPGRQVLSLIPGTAAAGVAFAGEVRPGQAVRILTGAPLPIGVDTVVLQEDTATGDGKLVFDGPVKPRANTRKAGEDVAQGALVLPAGHVLRAPDLALLAATGHAAPAVYQHLRVGVLSTGDELRAPGQATQPHHTHDANRPMLLSLMARWGYRAVDLGHVPDDRTALRAAFDAATGTADVVLTSGGASAGDEDHVSALLRSEGSLTAWRIALKPGRPLALAQWQGMPVFGLPGNPVAALICTLIFARPALAKLAGGAWTTPQGFTVPAAFTKAKKPGRREYLRARLAPDGAAEVFASEGSGRISGLSWATGLVELDDGAAQITPGTPVRYIPYASFGL